MGVNARNINLVSRSLLAGTGCGIVNSAKANGSCPSDPATPMLAQSPAQPAGQGSGQENAALAGTHSRRLEPVPLGGRAKRILDLVVAVPALIVSAPLMLVVALLVKVTAGGPVLFAHRRMGFNGRPFDCYKFRTMVANAEDVLRDHLANNPQAEQEWRTDRKLLHDPRVTFLGRMLRKSSVDELPQLFNILRGEMSCVGPRPIMADELQQYGAFSSDYLRARPGLTGLWQISGRSSTGYARRVVLDAQYVRNWSLWGDIAILAWTVVAVMRFEQAS